MDDKTLQEKRAIISKQILIIAPVAASIPQPDISGRFIAEKSKTGG